MFNYKIIDQFTTTNEIQERRYGYNGMYHRLYGPASIQWYEDGTINYEQWFIDGKLHRADGPAYLHWYEDGTPYWEQWFINGKLHRVDGPAYLHWYAYGILYKEGYWLYGIEINDAIKEWASTTGIKEIMAMTPDEFTMFKLTWGQG